MPKQLKVYACLLLLVCAFVQPHSLPPCLAKEKPPLEENLVLDKPNYDLWQEAVKLMKDQKYAEAAVIFRKLTVLVPTKGSPHCDLMNCLIKMGKLDEALTEALEAEKLAPDIPIYLSNLANAYQLDGKLDDAINTYSEFLHRFPDDANRGRTKAIIKDLKHAQAQKQGTPSQIGLEARIFSKWRDSKMPLRVYIQAGDSVANFNPDFERVLKESFQDWADASDGRISFQYVDKKKYADIVCVWEAERTRLTAAEDGNTRLESDQSGMIRSAHIILLTTAISGEPMSTVQMKGCALHEIGHALGISQHSRDPKDIMFYSMHGSQAASALTANDKSTLNQLYSQPDTIMPAPVSTKPIQFQILH